MMPSESLPQITKATPLEIMGLNVVELTLWATL